MLPKCSILHFKINYEEKMVFLVGVNFSGFKLKLVLFDAGAAAESLSFRHYAKDRKNKGQTQECEQAFSLDSP